MFFNNIKIAFRNIRSSFFYTTINIAGLSIGIAASILISLYVQDELSYDQFQTDGNRMYRVGLRARISGQEVEAATTCPPMASTVREELPEIEDAIRLAQWQEVPVKFEDKAFTERSVLLADSNFFSFFTYNLIQGDPLSVLDEPNKVVLSQSLVTKYFSDLEYSEVIGKIIEVGNDRFPCMITAIVEDAPENSHLPFNMILSMDTWEMASNTMWVNNFLYNYIKVYPGSDAEEVERKFADLVEKYVGPEAASVLGMDVENLSDDEFYYGYFLTPIKDIHLHSNLVAELKATSDIKYVYIFSIIAIFILFIAIINFVNLTTAKGGKRAKEVGIRKTAGALRGRLIGQFLMESILQSFLAMILSGAIIQLTLPYFNQISQKQLSFNVLNEPWLILFMLVFALLVGVLAGIYPSIYLTSFKTVDILKGAWGGSGKGKLIRSSLVIFQFAISSFLIMSTLVVYRQMNLLRSQNLGFDKEQVLVIKNGNSLGSAYSMFRENILGISGIKMVSKSSHLPPGVDNSSLFRPEGGNEDQLMHLYWADYDHPETFGLKIVQGRYYSKDFPSDSTAIVINQTALERFGWDTFEGHRILSFAMEEEGVQTNVVGVVKDFNYKTLREDIQPMAILLGDFGNLISIKLGSTDYTNIIRDIGLKWKELANGASFDYYFLDDEFDRIYRSEQRMGEVFMMFTVLAIIIACLGLFGLATFIAEQKTREIGIRKALGASLSNVVFTLSSDFVKLVGIAIIISMPVSYYLMNNWLLGFAYKANFSIWIFIGTGVLVLLIALLTVSYQAFSAGIRKPADALKFE